MLFHSRGVCVLAVVLANGKPQKHRNAKGILIKAPYCSQEKIPLQSYNENHHVSRFSFAIH